MLFTTPLLLAAATFTAPCGHWQDSFATSGQYVRNSDRVEMGHYEAPETYVLNEYGAGNPVSLNGWAMGEALGLFGSLESAKEAVESAAEAERCGEVEASERRTVRPPRSLGQQIQRWSQETRTR